MHCVRQWGGSYMALPDPNTIDLTYQKLRLAEDVIVWPVQERGKLVYRLEIPSLHRFYRVGYEEYVLMSLLDGKTTLPQACGLAARVLGSGAPTSAQAETIQRWLLDNELAYLESDGPPAQHDGRPDRWPSATSLEPAESFLDQAAVARRGWVGSSLGRQADLVSFKTSRNCGMLVDLAGFTNAGHKLGSIRSIRE